LGWGTEFRHDIEDSNMTPMQVVAKYELLDRVRGFGSRQTADSAKAQMEEVIIQHELKQMGKRKREAILAAGDAAVLRYPQSLHTPSIRREAEFEAVMQSARKRPTTEQKWKRLATKRKKNLNLIRRELVDLQPHLLDEASRHTVKELAGNDRLYAAKQHRRVGVRSPHLPAGNVPDVGWATTPTGAEMGGAKAPIVAKWKKIDGETFNAEGMGLGRVIIWDTKEAAQKRAAAIRETGWTARVIDRSVWIGPPRRVPGIPRYSAAATTQRPVFDWHGAHGTPYAELGLE
jgi:hypothetical protein